MIVVIDTNVVLPVLGLRHPYSAILDAWVVSRFAWTITTEIVLEYEEIVEPRIGALRWRQFIALLEAVEVRRRNLLRIRPQFRFHTIPADLDDDKFADCTIAAKASWIITEDRHFDALVGSGYQPQPIKPEEFIRRSSCGMQDVWRMVSHCTVKSASHRARDILGAAAQDFTQ